MALTSSVGPITSSCPAPVAASAGAMDARVAQMASAGSLAQARTLLTVGAPSLDDSLADEVARRSSGGRHGLSTGRALLEAGSAAAVEDLEELYDAGLPRGLPGGLAALAISQRAELIHRVGNQVLLKASMMLSQTSAHGQSQVKMRKLGVHNRRTKAVSSSKASGLAPHAPVDALKESGRRLRGRCRRDERARTRRRR